MDRLLKPKSDPVDRQATFETDSTQAHRSRSGGIKRGTLALPVIGSENSLQTPPIKEGTFESESGLQTPDTKKNRKQKPEHIHGKNGINVNLNDKNRKSNTDDPSLKKEKSEKPERNDKSVNKHSKINDFHPQETIPSSNNNYLKDKKPVAITKTTSLNIDGEKDTESKSSSTLTVNKKLKNDKRDSKQQELELNTLKKPEVKVNDVSLKNGNSNDSLSKSSNKRKPELKKQKDEGINVKARGTLSKDQLTRPAKEETKADQIKEKQSNVRNKVNLSDVSKTDEKSTTEVKGKKSSLEVINNEKQAKQESVKVPPVSKDEQIRQSTTAKQDQKNKSSKSKVYGSGESSKSKVSIKSLAEASERVENKEFDADALSIDLFQFEGENSHLPPTSTALKDSNIQTENFKPKKSSVTSQILETNVKKGSKNDQSLIADESIPTTKVDKQSKEKWKSSESSSLRKNSVDDRSTKTISDINNSSKNNISANSDSSSKSSSASEKYTQLHTSPRITHPERLVSPDIHTHTNLHITPAEREKFPEKRSSNFAPDYDNYENFKTSETFRMEPLKSRQPGAERMTESYESVYAERKTLLEAELAYKKRIKQLEDELNQFLRTIDDLRAENKALRLRIDDLESNTESVSPALDGHQSKNTIVIDTEKIGLEARIEDLEKRNKELEQRNTEVNAKVKLAASENESLSKDNEVLRKRIDSETPKSSTDKLQEESQKTIKSDEENRKSTEDLNKIRLELESTKKENEQLRKENEEHIRHQNSNSMEIEKLKQQVVDAKIESKKMEVEMERYRELATPRNDSAMSPNTEKMELKAQIIGLQTDNQSLNEDVIKMKAEHLETLKKLHDLEKTANSFQNSVTAVESEKLSEIQTLKNENSKLKTENMALQESLAQKKTEIQELMVVMKDDKFDTEIKELNDYKTKLTDSLKEKDEENQKLERKIEELTSKSEVLDKEKKICESNVESLAKLNDTRKAEIADLQQKLKDSISETEAEKSKLANLAKAEKDIEEANTRASKFEKDLDNERIKNGKETEELKAKHEKDRKQLKELHEQEIEEWRKKYIQLEKENQEEIRLLKLEIERLKEELEKLDKLKSAVNELDEAKSDILTLQNKYSQVVRDLEERSQVEQRNFELSLKIDALNKKVKQLEKENKEFQVQKDNANDIDSSTKRLTEENKRLREIVDKAQLNTKLEVLERKQKDAETRVKQLEGWVGDLYEEPREPATYAGKHRADKKKKQPFSKAAVPTVAEKVNKRPRSLDEVNIKVEEDKMTHSSTPSLPNIFDRDKNQQLSFGLGYSQIHKRRVNASTKYKK